MGTWPARWMPKAYTLTWLALIIISVSVMVGLYSRVVYTLWFKRDNNHQLAYQQKVRVTCSCIIFLSNCSLSSRKSHHAIVQYCAKLIQTIINENRENSELSAIFGRYFD